MKFNPRVHFSDVVQEAQLSQLMIELNRDLEKAREHLKEIAELHEGVLRTIRLIRTDFPPANPQVRHVLSFGNWIQSELEDVLFCSPAEAPTIFQRILSGLKEESIGVKIAKESNITQQGDGSEASGVDDAVIDLDKTDERIEN